HPGHARHGGGPAARHTSSRDAPEPHRRDGPHGPNPRGPATPVHADPGRIGPGWVKMPPRIVVSGLSKHFIRHPQGGVRVDALNDLDFRANAGECVCLVGPSGAGKSTLLRALYGTYRPSGGRIEISDGSRTVLLSDAGPLEILYLRRAVIGYASQF